MKIYFACLASYNNGRLHGVWIDTDGQTRDSLQDELNAMLRASPYPNVMVEHEGQQVPSAEEWAIHDYESEIVDLKEYTGLDSVMRLAAVEDLTGEWDAACIKYALECVGDDSDARVVESWLQDNYQGEYDTEADWAERFMDDTGGLEGVPEHLQSYFDYEAYARDARLGGDVAFVRDGGSLHVFWNH